MGIYEQEVDKIYNKTFVKKIISDNAKEKDLKFFHTASNFNRDIYQKGEEWFKSGLSFEDAPDEFKSNINFLNGFRRGERLAKIEELEREKVNKNK